MIQNEIFGPVISVQTFDDEDKAVEWANGVPLRAGLERLDAGPRARHAVSRRLDFGCVWINCHIPLVAEMPHGGYKQLRVRQGPLDVRPRGLHARQARHELHRAPRRLTWATSRTCASCPTGSSRSGCPRRRPRRSTATGSRSGRRSGTTSAAAGARAPAAGAPPPAGAEQIEFEAVEELVPGEKWRGALRGDVAGLPRLVPPGRAIRAPGPAPPAGARSSATCPSSCPIHERLVELAGGDELAARMLSLYRPPGFIVGCSQGAWTRDGGRCSCATTTTRSRASRASST